MAIIDDSGSELGFVRLSNGPAYGSGILRSVAWGSAAITVQDTGIGIPEEDMGQLFNRFHRGRNTAAYAGSGLGLAIVQGIMQRHNGQVLVTSAGSGTEVKLVLPPL